MMSWSDFWVVVLAGWCRDVLDFSNVEILVKYTLMLKGIVRL